MTPTDTQPGEWLTGHEAWASFAQAHPELGLGPGKWAFYNAMRRHRQSLLDGDALRIANGKHFIAHRERFPRQMFDLLTTRPNWVQRYQTEDQP